ncbi:MAG: hypothetical protein IT452_18000 [Planctomycetia bacterium]|nr:hypothetical protein [Planctomycetia bacterium]
MPVPLADLPELGESLSYFNARVLRSAYRGWSQRYSPPLDKRDVLALAYGAISTVLKPRATKKASAACLPLEIRTRGRLHAHIATLALFEDEFVQAGLMPATGEPAERIRLTQENLTAWSKEVFSPTPDVKEAGRRAPNHEGKVIAAGERGEAIRRFLSKEVEGAYADDGKLLAALRWSLASAGYRPAGRSRAEKRADLDATAAAVFAEFFPTGELPLFVDDSGRLDVSRTDLRDRLEASHKSLRLRQGQDGVDLAERERRRRDAAALAIEILRFCDEWAHNQAERAAVAWTLGCDESGDRLEKPLGLKELAERFQVEAGVVKRAAARLRRELDSLRRHMTA